MSLQPLRMRVHCRRWSRRKELGRLSVCRPHFAVRSSVPRSNVRVNRPPCASQALEIAPTCILLQEKSSLPINRCTMVHLFPSRMKTPTTRPVEAAEAGQFPAPLHLRAHFFAGGFRAAHAQNCKRWLLRIHQSRFEVQEFAVFGTQKSSCPSTRYASVPVCKPAKTVFGAEVFRRSPWPLRPSSKPISIGARRRRLARPYPR